MTIYRSPLPLQANIPDDLSIPQFIFGAEHPTRVLHPSSSPWIIDNDSSTKLYKHDMKSRVRGLANGLCEYGVGEEDVVLIYSRNHVDYITAVWAIHTLGAIVSGANPGFTSPELLYQIKATQPRIMIVDPEAIDTALTAAKQAGFSQDRILVFDTPAAAKVPNFTTVSTVVKRGASASPRFTERRYQPGEAKHKVAVLSFSSGTTGQPKAVTISHYCVIANVIQIALHNRVGEEYTSFDARRFRPGDVAIGVLPFYHIYGFVMGIHFMLWAGLSLVVIPKFNFVEMLKSIVHHRITHLMVVPPHAVLLCKHPAAKDYDLSHVRFFMTGAAPLSAEITQQLYALLPKAHIGQAYGMTETCTATSMFSITSPRGALGGSGNLLPGIEAKVIKDNGELADYDELGELWVKGPSNALSYLNNPKATAETFVDGWVRTGDEVIFRRNQEVFVVDRLKEMLKVKGHQVAPAELEGCILDHPQVRDVCVIGVPDDYAGEVPLAFVVPTQGSASTPSAAQELKLSIIDHVRKNKIGYKHLTGGVEIIDVIPKNPSGKLLRRVLRERAKVILKNRSIQAKL